MSSRPTRLTRLVARTAVATFILTTIAGTAHADTPNEQPSTTPTMIILDASGSMLNEDAPGLRIDAAKNAIHDMVASLPGNAKVGLEVYGNGTGSDEAEKDAGCRDVSTLVPVGPIDPETFLAMVDGIQASGYTPIGEALRHAARELPQEGPRAIVLVSDGVDTCAPPPPCDVAKEIAGDGLNLTVHAVGFKVDEDARTDLQCIAEATGGTYADASDATQLSTALEQKVEFALQNYDVVGTPIRGADSRTASDIPLLKPGQWVETFDAMPDGSTIAERYYRIDAPEGWTPHITATGVFPANGEKDTSGTAASLALATITPDGDSCEQAHDFNLWVDDANEPIVASISGACDDGDTLVKITRDDKVFYSNPMSVEILVHFEPPSDISHIAPPEEREIPEAPALDSEAVPVSGGLSFNSATELKAGQTYSATIISGEYLYFKVPMTWGQQISYRFRQGEVTGMEPHYAMNFSTDLYSPMRRWIASEFESWYAPGNSVESADVRGGTAEVLRATSRKVNLDGYYYLTIHTGMYDEGEVTQDFTFRVDTVGDIEEGPIYLTGTEAQSAEAAPKSETPASVPIDPVTPESGGSSPWLGVGIGAIIVLGLGVAAIIFRRRGAGRG